LIRGRWRRRVHSSINGTDRFFALFDLFFVFGFGFVFLVRLRLRGAHRFRPIV
jgi:hypothetical protein